MRASYPSSHKRTTMEDENGPSAEQTHRKRVAQILRYLSRMHNATTTQISFVRNVPLDVTPPPFFQQFENDLADEEICRILFTIYDFQRLAGLIDKAAAGPHFTFYKTQGSLSRNNRRGFFNSTSPKNEDPNASNSCWLRLIRSPIEQPPLEGSVVSRYLNDWCKAQGRRNPDSLLTLKNLERAPSTTNPRVLRFLKSYKKFLQKKTLRRTLEPIYNGLFEYYQDDDHQHNLIWGLGRAIYRLGDEVVDGPLLHVCVEVELARDGALLVRPKQHTGVTINQAILSALNRNNSEASARALNQRVEDIDPFDLSPGEPSTYIPLLKHMAVELSSGGSFQSSKTPPVVTEGKLLVTDAWCLFSSPRPSAVWARDALAFVEQNSVHQQILPKALWSLTHGSGALDQPPPQIQDKISSTFKLFQQALASSFSKNEINAKDKQATNCRPPFPLPTSDAQNQIAELLLTKKYPAVVCEGPPGTGKTHTIANIVCAYLSLGKRVLVTSKGAPALSVLRERLPSCVQELCVDVSMSESAGMRMLQQTVERLANKIAWVNSEREAQRTEALQGSIDELEAELKSIDDKLRENAEEKRLLVQSHEGQELFELSLDLIQKAPWLMKTLAKWDKTTVERLYKEASELTVESIEAISLVTGYPLPAPSDSLISFVASKAGSALSYLRQSTKMALGTIPFFGKNLLQEQEQIEAQVEEIRIRGSRPSKPSEWRMVLQALQHAKAVDRFICDELQPLVTMEAWPEEEFVEIVSQRRRIRDNVVSILKQATRLKQLSETLEISEYMENVVEHRKLDSRRTSLARHIQQLAEDLVAGRVVTELGRSFTSEAQSALVKFAQVSGRSKFVSSAKMSQRQKRKRSEYLEAFSKCLRCIPAWIMTSSQVSDYLPAECLFDLVVIDEASQSDITVLPGMLRGKQWLIVGDGKQVSPTESFVSEESIEMLKAALPESPFASSMLPGHSFFDLCAQAFPKGRTILREHFRCAPEIISFSNTEFYNRNLTPLRFPTSQERLSPSLLDIRIPNGQKRGKTNEEECDEIVRQIKMYVESCALAKKRSIGVISLVGDEQSRIIRGRLLDAVGPHKFKLHNILVGEPPSFQGAERDIVYLSMVCSPNSIVTQNQLMHAQRANVALSRARDRMVLVRSCDSNHIPNDQDIKLSILEFFEKAGQGKLLGEEEGPERKKRRLDSLAAFRKRAEKLLKNLLVEKGYHVMSMGVVWDDALCVEDSTTAARAAICVESSGESMDDWNGLLQQQKSIERVGWSCLRVDALSFLSDHCQALASIEDFLSEHHVFSANYAPAIGEAEDPRIEVEVEQDIAANEPETIVISSDEEGGNFSEGEDDRKPAAIPDNIVSDELGFGERAEDYGAVADLGFLSGRGVDVGSRPSRGHPAGGRVRDVSASTSANDHRRTIDIKVESGSVDEAGDTVEDKEEADLSEKQRAVVESTRQTFSRDEDLSNSSDDEAPREGGTSVRSARSKSSRRRKLDKYSRDGRYYYNKKSEKEDDDLTYQDYLREVEKEKAENEDGTPGKIPRDQDDEEDEVMEIIRDGDSEWKADE